MASTIKPAKSKVIPAKQSARSKSSNHVVKLAIQIAKKNDAPSQKSLPVSRKKTIVAARTLKKSTPVVAAGFASRAADSKDTSLVSKPSPALKTDSNILLQLNLPIASKQMFFNRELGVLVFNQRVLALAEDSKLPLLERLRYVCIVSNNLDEFFEIRVAGIKAQINQQITIPGNDGLTPEQVFKHVTEVAHQLVQRQYSLLNQEILPALKQQDVNLHLADQWTAPQRKWAHEIFVRDVMPLLTPLGLDPAHPFPRLLNKSLNFAVSLSGKDAFGRKAPVAIVQAPRTLPRLVEMPQTLSGFKNGYVLLSSLIQAFVADLFPGLSIHGCYQFRVTRNSDLYVDEEEITNLRLALQGELNQRHFGDAVRLELAANATPDIEQFLLREFSLTQADTYRIDGPVNLNRLSQLVDLVTRSELKFPSFRPGLPANLGNLSIKGSNNKIPHFFKLISRRDILLHHPYQSFQPVIDFLIAAASDPAVLAIKQTIYRTGEDSELMELLLAAARNGKEVTVVVELMARFDEQTNINWAARLEAVGAHVVYGVVGHKTHAKMSLILRREKEGLKRYAHLGTGNYHTRTSRLYTDFGLFTADVGLCEDVEQVFQQMTGLGEVRKLKQLLLAPFTLHDGIIAMIRREVRHAKAGRKTHIMAKMNALLAPTVISELYKASKAGVKIDLIVRGVCALRPGVPGLSENIHVRSIVGRFLEHSRVFYFFDDGKEPLYLASADWMERNFFRRVEVAFPILDKSIKRRIIDEDLKGGLQDTQLAWQLKPDGSYVRPAPKRTSINLHDRLMMELGQQG